MSFTFEPSIAAGLSRHAAKCASTFPCAALGIVPTVRPANYPLALGNAPCPNRTAPANQPAARADPELSPQP